MANKNIFGLFQNGIRESKFNQKGFDTLVGCDIHNETGSVRGSLAMTKSSGTTVTELCKSVAVLPNGDSFWFSSSSGKIWKRTSAGVWSLVHTNTQGTCLGGQYFNGYLYYASASKLGRIAEANASSEATWSSQTDSWKTFTNADTLYHPMCEQALSLFIGDGKYIASVDASGTFSANSLDLQTQHRATALVPYLNDILIGTIVGNYVNKSGIFCWDTYSSSWSYEDYIDEAGINMFIPSDNTIFLTAGTVGNIYYWTGSRATKYKRLRDSNNTISTSISPYGATNLNGLPLIANSRGIYSLGSADSSLSPALNIEYVPVLGQGATVGACVAIGTQVLVSTSLGTSYEVDEIGTNRYPAIIQTPVAYGHFRKVKVHYTSLPDGTSIGISTSLNGGDWVERTPIVDAKNNVVSFDGGLLDCNFLQAKITLTNSTSSTPVITAIEFI